MTELRRAAPAPPANPWPLVLCLVGVDYFSTLAYLPSIAVQAAGPLAPIAAAAIVLVTFLLALPVYWYVVGRSPDGRGATGLLEDHIPGWRGKLIVLTLLGFAAADFVITRSLSVADAAIHLLNNPHGRTFIDGLNLSAWADEIHLWQPFDYLLHRIAEPRVAVSLCLSITSFLVWQILKRGVRRNILLLMAVAVLTYLALSFFVIAAGLLHVSRHAEIVHAWRESAGLGGAAGPLTAAPGHWSLGPWVSVVLWSFPQMALGLSGFEMIMTVTPGVRGGRRHEPESIVGRVRNTRKLMLVAGAIMAVYLISAVTVATLLIPAKELAPGGAAEHRALAYLAHGSLATNHEQVAAISPYFGERFGDVYDASSMLILCLAGATVTMGLRNLLPHYLHRLGMDVNWAGRVGAILLVLNVVVLLVTVVFRASPSSQQWAYATSVLVLLTGAALAAIIDVNKTMTRRFARWVRVPMMTLALVFFLSMTGLTVWINQSGLAIAMAFVAAILISSIASRWIRSTELRFEGFDFDDEATRRRWEALGRSGPKVLAPHRPGLMSVTEKSKVLQRAYRLDPMVPLIFIEAILGDPSNFYQKPLMKIEREEGLEVIRVSKCVSISHVLAAICVEMCRGGGAPPEIIFGWSQESPLAANLNFLLLGEGNIPWMVKELVSRAMSESSSQPRIVIG